jgi:hypothetical protein
LRGREADDPSCVIPASRQAFGGSTRPRQGF